jgi:hypothetical protein
MAKLALSFHVLAGIGTQAIKLLLELHLCSAGVIDHSLGLGLDWMI